MKGIFYLLMDETLNCSGTSHTVCNKIKLSFLKKTAQNPFFKSQNFVLQGQTDIVAGNSGYSL